MTEKQCKNCKYGYIEEYWFTGMDEEIWGWDCENEEVSFDDKLDYLYDHRECPFFEVIE